MVVCKSVYKSTDCQISVDTCALRCKSINRPDFLVQVRSLRCIENTDISMLKFSAFIVDRYGFHKLFYFKLTVEVTRLYKKGFYGVKATSEPNSALFWKIECPKNPCRTDHLPMKKIYLLHFRTYFSFPGAEAGDRTCAALVGGQSGSMRKCIILL